MVQKHPGLLSSEEEIRALAEKLKAAKVIAFDTEFIRENTFYPVVEIIQVATDSESWLVDAKALKTQHGPSPAMQPLLEVFEDPTILKVAHAIQGDQECLYTSFGVVATPSLDTAIAASLCGYGDGIGLGNLLKAALGVSIKKGHARTDWSVRPLPSQLADYAHADVEHLVGLGQKLIGELEKAGRKEWAFELTSKMEDKRAYELNAEEIAQRLAKGGRLDRKGYAALIELARWREERVRHLNLPRRWVADDNVLVDLAHVRPKDMQHLSAFRGLSKGELKNSGNAILAALQRASQIDESSLPLIPRPDVPSPSESQVLDLLKCYLGILADRHRIASRHLMTAPQLLPLLRSKASSPEQLIERKLLSEGAAKLVGEELIALMQGRRALSVRGSKIDIVRVEEAK